MAKSYSEIKKLSKQITTNRRKVTDEPKPYKDIKVSDYNFNGIREQLENTIRFDTFQSDLSSMGKTIEDSHNNWQTQETMNNTRSSIEAMQKRLGAYNEYQRLFGGKDNANGIKAIDTLRDEVMNTLDGWDDLGKEYGKYKSADAYTSEKNKLTELYSMDSKQLKGKKGVAYTTSDGYNIKWEDLYNDAYSREYEANIDKTIDVSKSGNYKKKDAKLSTTWNGYVVVGDEDAYLYNYVNGDKEARDSGTLTNVNMSGTYDFLKNKHLTEDEKTRFNALWETQGPEKAKEYLGLLDSDLRQRRVEHEKTLYAKDATENPFATSVASVIQNLGNNAMALPFLAMDYAEDGDIDPNSSLYTGRRAVQTTRSTVENDVIDSDTGKFFYRHGMNIADNLASRAVSLGVGSGVASQFLMSSGAAVDSMVEAKERGLSDEQAIGLGAISGAAEWFFESKGFESWVDTKTLSRSAWKYFANNLKTELVGEIFTEGTNDIADYFIAQDLNKLNTEYKSLLASGVSEKEAFLKVVGGIASRYVDVAAGTILSTGVMAGPGATIGGIQQHSYNKGMGRNIKANERVSDVFDIASNPEVASAYDTYTRYANKGINADNISDAKLGNLYSTAKADAQEVLDSKESTVEQRDAAQKALDNLEVYAQQNVASRTGAVQNINKKVLKDYDAEAIVTLIESGLESAEDTDSHRIATELKAKVEDYDELAEIVNKKMNGEKLTADESKVIADSKVKLSADEIANLSDANDRAIRAEESNDIATQLVEKGESEEIANLVARKMRGETLTTEEAEKVLESENALLILAENSNAENSNAQLLETAKSMGKENGALFVSLYDGETDIDAYTNAFNLAVTKAEKNFGIKELLKHKSVLSNEQVGKIYSEVTIKTAHNKRIEFQRLSEKTANLKAYKGVIDDSVIDYNNTSAKGKVNWNDLSPEKRQEVTFAKGLAQVTGMNLVFITDGEAHNINGSYSIDGNTITIDIFAEGRLTPNKLIDAFIPTMSHELTHWMENKSPVLFRKICDIVFPTLEKADGLSESERITIDIDKALAKEYKKKYEKENPGKTISLDKALKSIPDDVRKEAYNDNHRIEVARSEIVARACEDMLSRSKVGREMFNSLSKSEQKTLIDKIKDIIQNIKDWINNVLGLYESTSYEAQMLKRFDEEMDKLSALWDEMFKESVEVNQSLEKSGSYKHKNGAEGEVRNSIRQTHDGIQYVVLDKNLFVDSSGKELTPRQAYNALVGQKIMLEDGDIITFVKRLPGNKDMYNELFKRYPAFKDEINIKAVNEAINKNIVEIVETSKITKRNEPQRYNHLGVVDFDKREVYVTDENVVYSLTLAIANLTDGKKVAYAKSFIENTSADIVAKIKKAETVRKSRLNQLSNNSISNPKPNVNTKFSDTEDIRFSMRENVEETKDLIAVHNMQVSELERTLDLGGLPMPSIAIIKAKSGHSEYGDVSLVFKKDTIDPKASRLNKVYGGDAWTPTYPTIEYKPNEKVTKKINDKYYEFSRKFGYDESRPLYNYVYDMEDILNRHKGEAEMIAELYEDEKMMQVYLLDTGKNKVETIKKEIRTELTDAEVEMNEFFISELGENVVDEIMWDGNGTPMAYRKNYLSKYEGAIREAYKKLLSKKYNFTDEQVQNVMDSTKNADLIRFMRDAHKYRENGRVTTRTEDDYEATKKAIKDAAGDGYRTWIDSLFKGIEEKSGIRNNVDYFTNSGNRRSWEALHWENNLENVIKVMKSQDNGVAALFSGHAIWAVSAKDYRSIEEIKADADRLKQLPEEEYNKIKEGFGERFQEIAHSIMSKTESNPFIASDNAMSCIVEAVRNSKTKSGLLKNLKEYSQLNVTETTADDIISLVADISNMPTEYFEAKPQRAVELNEIATAIIPDNTSEGTKTRLSDMGIKYLEYESSNEQSRLDALNSLEDVRFSDRDSEGNTLTEAQAEFFKNSKVRDEDGNLLVLYHGTPNKGFTVFDKSKQGSTDKGVWGRGFYFSTSEEKAQIFARGNNGEVKKSYLNLTNPFVISDYKSVDEISDYLGVTKPAFTGDERAMFRYDSQGVLVLNTKYSQEFSDAVEKKGHDGVIAEDEIVAFESNQIKLTTNTNPTLDPDTRYSDRDNTSVYDIMGETERIKKENERFKAEIERLRERLKIERQVTKGNYFNENQLGAAAGHLRNISKSLIAKDKLVNSLKDVYSFIAHSPELTWEDVFERCYRVAEDMIAEAKPEVEVNDYYKTILRDIRNKRISFSEMQKQEASHIFGKNWNRNFFGRVTIADGGIPVDSQWDEWASMYPDTFNADITDTDMPGELYDIINSLQDASETVAEYDTEERTRWLAREIYNQYWNVSPIRTTADKYDKQIRLLNFEHRRIMTEFREEYNSRLKEQHKADKERYKKLVADIRERKDKQIAQAKEHGREMVSKYKENAERKTHIQRITANALTLNKWLTKNSKDYHIHEAMKGPVVKLLNAIDFSSKSMIEKGEQTQKDASFVEAFAEVRVMLQDADNMVEGLESLYGHDLAEDIERLAKSTYNLVGDNNYIINAMGLEELQSLDKLVRHIKKVVTELNKFHTIHHNQGAVSLANEFMEHGEKLGNLKKQHGKMGKYFEFRNRTPYYFFKDLGNVGKKLFEAFQDGWDKLAFNAKKVIDFADETYTAKEVKQWSKETKEFKLTQADGSERTFKMSIAQIMALRCVSKQEDAQKHLLSGGMTLKRIDKKGHVVADYENITLTLSDLQSILATLNDRQREVADKLQEFMNTVCSEWGNEISMARFGIEQFGIPDYFPIKVSEATVPTDNTKDVDNASLFRLLNMSFTKARNKHADQSIEIGDIFDIFAQHSSDMAKYNALALPVLDFNKFYSIHGKDFAGKEYGVAKTLKSVFGDEANGYLRRFVRDLNGSQNVSRDVIGNTFFKNAKLASVAANLRVVLLQPTAFFKASAILDNKYLLKASAYVKVEPIGMVKKLKKAIANAEKYCGIVQWKSLGYYDTDISKGLTEKIKHADSLKDKAVEKSLKGAELADKVTFGTLWVACEFEIRDTRKDLKVGSEEFYNAIGKRLREVVYATQVVDSTMTRSDMMRSSDKMDKMYTTFGSEPTIAYNMLLDMVTQYNRDKQEHGNKEARKRNAKKIRNVVTAYVITNAVAALVESGFDVLRDDDDEEMDAAEFMKLYLKNFAFDMSIGNKLPFIKELYSIMQGYSSSRMDTQWMQFLYNTYKDFDKIFSGEGNWSKTIKDLAKAMSYLSGLPFYNVYRDAMAIIDKLGLLDD